jgi:dipeptidase
MQLNKLKYVVLLLLLIFSFNIFAQDSFNDDFNCFSILIGKNATIDGSVMLAHNEDDGGERIVNWFKVPRSDYQSNDSLRLHRGPKIPQVAQTYAFVWLEMPELEFSDSYINEFGLTIASDACPSREDEAKIIDGGIGYWLRRLMIERAKTAREAIKLAGVLIEKIGYASSGRTYCIADTNETWMLSVVKGQHWVAQRVPDNQVAIIPNYYTITKVNLKDTTNYLGSHDLIDYAIKRGWYNQQEDGNFNFRKAYSNQNNLKHIVNKARHWISINALSKKQYDLDAIFPFSFIPKKKLGLKDVYKVLRNHYKGTSLDLSATNQTGNPHQQKTMSVCAHTTQYGFVAQLRNQMPSEIGNVLWIAPKRPCTQAFIPVYAGIESLPKSFSKSDYTTALSEHFNKISNYKIYTENHSFQYFIDNADRIDFDYKNLIDKQQKKLYKLENKLLRKQNRFEKKVLKVYKKDKKKAKKLITGYTDKQINLIIKK